jgi:hypothetical protein
MQACRQLQRDRSPNFLFVTLSATQHSIQVGSKRTAESDDGSASEAQQQLGAALKRAKAGSDADTQAEPSALSSEETSESNVAADSTDASPSRISRHLLEIYNALPNSAMLVVVSQPPFERARKLAAQKRACLSGKTISVWTDALEEELKRETAECNFGEVIFIPKNADSCGDEDEGEQAENEMNA